MELKAWLTREEKGRLRVNCLNWKSYVLKTGFLRQKNGKQSWRWHSYKNSTKSKGGDFEPGTKWNALFGNTTQKSDWQLKFLFFYCLLDRKWFSMCKYIIAEDFFMNKYIYDENNGFWYELQGDYYIPCLELPIEKKKGILVYGISPFSVYLWV